MKYFSFFPDNRKREPRLGDRLCMERVTEAKSGRDFESEFGYDYTSLPPPSLHIFHIKNVQNLVADNNIDFYFIFRFAVGAQTVKGNHLFPSIPQRDKQQ